MSTSHTTTPTLPSVFALYQQPIADALNTALSLHSQPEKLLEAMRYAVLQGGKRFRPTLMLSIADLLEIPLADLSASVAAIEFIHAYSLVHDDLPCLDNDDLRRGKPTTHVAYGQAMALLAGDALQALAFETLLAPHSTLQPSTQAKLAYRFSQLVGLGQGGTQLGLVNGQALDVLSENIPQACQDTLHQIHHGKTAALLTFCTEAPGIISQQPADVMALLTLLGQEIGLIFQIADDLLDLDPNNTALGKTAGKDAEQNKLTFPRVFGVEESQKRLAQHHQDTINLLAKLTAMVNGSTIKSMALTELINFIVDRNH